MSIYYEFSKYINILQEGIILSYFLQFELKAIYINDTDSGYKGVLKNWLHISVESAVELEGLYVQSIGYVITKKTHNNILALLEL